MRSLKYIYKIGFGPSSSHAMGPAKAAGIFKNRMKSPDSSVQVELMGSLALTGKGHLTDKAIARSFDAVKTHIVYNETAQKLKHPNTMVFREMDERRNILQEWRVYSIGGGELADQHGPVYTDTDELKSVYPFDTFDGLKKFSLDFEADMVKAIISCETEELWDTLRTVWNTMQESIKRGLNSKKEWLPGKLKLKRKAKDIYSFANKSVGIQRDFALIHSYALAVAEENASGNVIVTAPTCGSSGVLPATLYYFHHNLNYGEKDILNALAVAGMIGTIIKQNASISGAEVGCQGEIGSACAMAAAATISLNQGSLELIEYAAEIAIEHFLGLTCDPILGLVQIPCIERNALASVRAFQCANYVLSTKLGNKIRFDDVLKVMYKTGIDMQNIYKETALGGLASLYIHNI